MTKDSMRLLEKALLLPAEVRAEIAEELLATLDGYEADVEVAWAAEIERRVADARANPGDSVEWREALRNIEREVLGR